ncbi:helix-turn-helix domain-containing protein [Anaerofustis stercorihominis]|uniref:XRE family transcriptional regulator n=1 Tax=Anaerofustis stercorihominis TaxID=214853 RepID=A0A3E3DXQ1_9FIRM|nr:helix-turn-helix transcriptional regulator [Anaerofustis stercorihominis]RGD73739.1 XRE family transcriptional regulator [Anaerofustis stercorihominis]
MNTIEAIKRRILQLCEEKNISINQLANYSGLAPSTLKGILYDRSRNPKIITLKIICDGLDITLGQFFSTSEFDNLEQEIK